MYQFLLNYYSLKNKATKTENSISELLLQDMQKLKDESKQIQQGETIIISMPCWSITQSFDDPACTIAHVLGHFQCIFCTPFMKAMFFQLS